MPVRRQFILQFQIEEHGSTEDLDRLISIEETLDGALRRNSAGYVDGHDIGSGQMNIFMISPSWSAGEQFLELYLEYQDWATDVVVAKDKRDGTYEIVWPEAYEGNFTVT
jgi:hypothetical protein